MTRLMDKFSGIIEFVFACIIFLGVVVEAVAQISKGAIHSRLGFIVTVILVLLTLWSLIVAWRELRKLKN